MTTLDANKPRLNPCLKWVGGKRQLLDKLIAKMPDEFETYYEPFIGGAALLLAIQPDKAVINDVNCELINMYRELQQHPEELVDALKATASQTWDAEKYYALRAELNTAMENRETGLAQAVRFLCILRMSFNGLWRCNRKGGMNSPWNKKTTISYDYQNLRDVSSYLSVSQITMLIGDFADAVEDAKEGDFVYFDSPYVPETVTASFTSYTKDGFGLEDHQRLATLCQKLDAKGVKFMLSNNDVPLVHELYEGFIIDSVDARRAINSDGSKRKGKEVIITNYEK